jgi:hypothetical protein
VGPTIVGIISRYLGVAEEEFKEGNPSFFEALENQEISGLDTYNIKKNPRYRDAFSSEIVEVDDDGCPSLVPSPMMLTRCLALVSVAAADLFFWVL